MVCEPLPGAGGFLQGWKLSGAWMYHYQRVGGSSESTRRRAALKPLRPGSAVSLGSWLSAGTRSLPKRASPHPAPSAHSPRDPTHSKTQKASLILWSGARHRPGSPGLCQLLLAREGADPPPPKGSPFRADHARHTPTPCPRASTAPSASGPGTERLDLRSQAKGPQPGGTSPCNLGARSNDHLTPQREKLRPKTRVTAWVPG